MVFDDGLRYRLLSLLQGDPQMSQRALADALGISLGKVNFCLKTLMAKGCVRAKRFQAVGNKSGYAYVLTPDGIEEKARVTFRCLQKKVAECEALQEEIEGLRQEAGEEGERGMDVVAPGSEGDHRR